MSDETSKLISFFRKGSARLDGEYSLLLRGERVTGAGEREAVTGITISCRAGDIKVDSIDTGTRINDRIIYNYRLSFIGSNHKLLEGSNELYSKLPASVAIELNLPSQPLTQWDGLDVEVSGTSYEHGGTFDANSVVIPKLGGLKIEESKRGIGEFLFIFAIIAVVGTIILAYAN